MKKGVYKQCLTCGKEIYVYQYELKRKKFCSKSCFYSSADHREAISQWMKNRKVSPSTKKKMSESRLGKEPWNKGIKYLAVTGEKNNSWKGDEVGYDALHDWVNRHLGKAKKCIKCGKEGTGRQIHWANKSREYKRDLSDWLELCAKCHKKYDKTH